MVKPNEIKDEPMNNTYLGNSNLFFLFLLI